LHIVDTALASAAERAGIHLACYPGCAVCCFGPFPITQADAARLRSGLDKFAQSNPIAATAIVQRAVSARERLATGAPSFPGNPATGHLTDDFDEAAFAARFSDLACPVLDPDSGHCLLHESRPIACRLYGLPSRVDGHDLPPCPLCFKRATTDEIETSRAIIDLRSWDPPECETSPSDSLPEDAQRTLVAYALGTRSLHS